MPGLIAAAYDRELLWLARATFNAVRARSDAKAGECLTLYAWPDCISVASKSKRLFSQRRANNHQFTSRQMRRQSRCMPLVACPHVCRYLPYRISEPTTILSISSMKTMPSCSTDCTASFCTCAHTLTVKGDFEYAAYITWSFVTASQRSHTYTILFQNVSRSQQV